MRSMHMLTRIIRTLITLSGADVNVMDVWSQTPLFYCVGAEWLKVTDLLIHSGSNLEARDKDSMTPLHRSVKCSTTEIMQKLIRLTKIFTADVCFKISL